MMDSMRQKQQHSPPSLPAVEGAAVAEDPPSGSFSTELNYLRALLFCGDVAKERRFISEYFEFFAKPDGPLKILDNEFQFDDSEFAFASRVLFCAAKHAVQAMKNDYPPSAAEESWYSKRFIKKIKSNNANYYKSDAEFEGDFKNFLQNLTVPRASQYYLCVTLTRFIEFHVQHYQNLMVDSCLDNQFNLLCNYSTYASAVEWLNSPKFDYGDIALSRDQQKKLLVQLLEAFPVEKYEGVFLVGKLVQTVMKNPDRHCNEDEQRGFSVDSNHMAPSAASSLSRFSCHSGGVESVSGGSGGDSSFFLRATLNISNGKNSMPSTFAAKLDVNKPDADEIDNSSASGNKNSSGEANAKKPRLSFFSTSPLLAALVAADGSSSSHAISTANGKFLVEMSEFEVASLSYVTHTFTTSIGFVVRTDTPPLAVVETVDDVMDIDPMPASELFENSAATSAEPSVDDSSLQPAPAPATSAISAVPDLLRSESVASNSSSSSSPSRRRTRTYQGYNKFKNGMMQPSGLLSRVQASPKCEPISRTSSTTSTAPATGVLRASQQLPPSMSTDGSSQNGLQNNRQPTPVVPATSVGNTEVQSQPPISAVSSTISQPSALSTPSSSENTRRSSLLFQNGLVKTEVPYAPLPAVGVPVTAQAAVAGLSAQPVADANEINVPMDTDGSETINNADVANSQAPLVPEQQSQQQQAPVRIKTEEVDVRLASTAAPRTVSSVASNGSRKPTKTPQSESASSAVAPSGSGVGLVSGNVAASLSSSSSRGMADQNSATPVATEVADNKRAVMQFSKPEGIQWSKQYKDIVFQFLISSFYRDLYSQAGQQLLPGRAYMFWQELEDIRVLFFDKFCSNDTKGMEIAKLRAKLNALAAEASEQPSLQPQASQRRRSLSPSASSTSSSSKQSAAKAGLTQQKIIDYCVSFLDWVRLKVLVSADDDDNENSPDSRDENDDEMADSASADVRRTNRNYAADTYSGENLPSSLLFQQHVLDLMLRVTLCRLKRPARLMQLRFVSFCCRLCSERGIGDANEHFKSCAAAKSHREAAENVAEPNNKIAGIINTVDMLMKCGLCTDAGVADEAAEFKLSHIGEHFCQKHDLSDLETLHDAIDAKEASSKKRRGSTASAKDEDSQQNNDMPTINLKFIKQILPVAVMCDECDTVFTQISRYVQHIMPSRHVLSHFHQPLPTTADGSSYRSIVWKRFYNSKLMNQFLSFAEGGSSSCCARFTCRRRLPLLVLPAKGKQVFALPLQDSFILFKYTRATKADEESNVPPTNHNNAQQGDAAQQQPNSSVSAAVSLAGSVPSSPMITPQPPQNTPECVNTNAFSGGTISGVSSTMPNNVQNNFQALQMPDGSSTPAATNRLNDGMIQQPQLINDFNGNGRQFSANFAGRTPQQPHQQQFGPYGAQQMPSMYTSVSQGPCRGVDMSYGQMVDCQQPTSELNYMPGNGAVFSQPSGSGNSYANMRGNMASNLPNNNMQAGSANFVSNSSCPTPFNSGMFYQQNPRMMHSHLFHQQQQVNLQHMQQQHYQQQQISQQQHRLSQQQQRLDAAASSGSSAQAVVDTGNRTAGNAHPHQQNATNVVRSSVATNTTPRPSPAEPLGHRTVEQVFARSQQMAPQMQQQQLQQAQQRGRRGNSAISNANPAVAALFSGNPIDNNNNVNNTNSNTTVSNNAAGVVLSRGVVPPRNQQPQPRL